jgi:hypothetical protein
MNRFLSCTMLRILTSMIKKYYTAQPYSNWMMTVLSTVVFVTINYH